ncbi:hypothetical protein ABZ281_31985, partial [Streptomyces sp. NPDC006265]
MTEPVAVTGVGLLTPAGEDSDATWGTVCRGVGGAAASDPVLAGLPVDFSCRVPLSRDALDRRVGRDAWRMSRNAAPAPEFDIDCVTEEPRRQDVRVAVSHSFGFGGHNVVLALARSSCRAWSVTGPGRRPGWWPGHCGTGGCPG